MRRYSDNVSVQSGIVAASIARHCGVYGEHRSSLWRVWRAMLAATIEYPSELNLYRIIHYTPVCAPVARGCRAQFGAAASNVKSDTRQAGGHAGRPSRRICHTNRSGEHRSPFRRGDLLIARGHSESAPATSSRSGEHRSPFRRGDLLIARGRSESAPTTASRSGEHRSPFRRGDLLIARGRSESAPATASRSGEHCSPKRDQIATSHPCGCSSQ